LSEGAFDHLNPWPLDPLNPYDTLNRATNDVFGSQYTPLLSFLEVNVSIKVDKLFHFFSEGIRDFYEKSFHLFPPIEISSFQRNLKIIGIYK
jgi:hypothetical protein